MGTVFLAEDRMRNNITRVVKQLIHRNTGEDSERKESVRLFMRVSVVFWVLYAGRVIATAPPDRVRRDPRVIAAYLGREA